MMEIDYGTHVIRFYGEDDYEILYFISELPTDCEFQVCLEDYDLTLIGE